MSDQTHAMIVTISITWLLPTEQSSTANTCRQYQAVTLGNATQLVWESQQLLL